MKNPSEQIEKLHKFAEKAEIHANLPVVESLDSIGESLKAIAERESPESPEIQKISIEGVELVTIKGDKGDKGEQGEKGESIVGPQGEKGEKGDRGDTGLAGRDGENGRDGESIVGPKGEDGKDGSPDTGEQIIEKINDADGVIDRERVEGLEELVADLKKQIKSASASGGVRRVFQPYVDDFTGQTDGSTKTFTLSREPLRTNTIQVFGTDFPIVLRPTTDFTVAGKILTLTSAVPAPSQGATLIIHYFA